MILMFCTGNLHTKGRKHPPHVIQNKVKSTAHMRGVKHGAAAGARLALKIHEKYRLAIVQEKP